MDEAAVGGGVAAAGLLWWLLKSEPLMEMAKAKTKKRPRGSRKTLKRETVKEYELGARRKPFTNLPPGIRVQWSATNQAYLVMWHDEVIRALSTRAEVEDYLADLRRERASTGGLGARRKSLTFGKMPSFQEFEKAFEDETEEFDGCYPMELRGIDSVTAEAVSVPVRKEYKGQPCYSATSLYTFVEKLAAIWESDIPDEPEDLTEGALAKYEDIIEAWDQADPGGRYSLGELRENAGNLASGIMETLGFEWI